MNKTNKAMEQTYSKEEVNKIVAELVEHGSLTKEVGEVIMFACAVIDTSKPIDNVFSEDALSDDDVHFKAFHALKTHEWTKDSSESANHFSAHTMKLLRTVAKRWLTVDDEENEAMEQVFEIEEIVGELVQHGVISKEVGDVLIQSNIYSPVLTDESLDVSELLVNLVRLMNKKVERIIKDDEYVYVLKPLAHV